jgi:hypothetical protein
MLEPVMNELWSEAGKGAALASSSGSSASTEVEHVRALFFEALGDGEPNAVVSAANNGDLAF